LVTRDDPTKTAPFQVDLESARELVHEMIFFGVGKWFGIATTPELTRVYNPICTLSHASTPPFFRPVSVYSPIYIQVLAAV
jgi:hypothetical protein